MIFPNTIFFLLLLGSPNDALSFTNSVNEYEYGTYSCQPIENSRSYLGDPTDYVIDFDATKSFKIELVPYIRPLQCNYDDFRSLVFNCKAKMEIKIVRDGFWQDLSLYSELGAFFKSQLWSQFYTYFDGRYVYTYTLGAYYFLEKGFCSKL